MQTLRWMRVPGDTIFALGAAVLVWAVLTVTVRHLWRVKASTD